MPGLVGDPVQARVDQVRRAVKDQAPVALARLGQGARSVTQR